MAKLSVPTKRMAISKANARMVAVVALASFVTTFCLVASKAVLSQNQYNAKLTTEKSKTNDQLKKNLVAFDDLAHSYKAFDATSTNIIGGISAGTGDNDGKNSKIILDALPSSYDFPGLTSSLEKLFNDHSFHVTSITGTDDQLNQQANNSSATPVAVAMPFSFVIDNASYQTVGQLVSLLQQSIRPIQIDSMTISGGANDMTINVEAHTYYQPGKSFNISQKEVK